jgi:hypothetical protein
MATLNNFNITCIYKYYNNFQTLQEKLNKLKQCGTLRFINTVQERICCIATYKLYAINVFPIQHTPSTIYYFLNTNNAKKKKVSKRFTNTSRPCCMPLAVFWRKWTYRKRIFSYEKEIQVEISPGVQL